MPELEMSGIEFRRLRRALDLTQSEMGKMLGCTRQHISNLEDKASIPPVYVLAVRQLEALRLDVAA